MKHEHSGSHRQLQCVNEGTKSLNVALNIAQQWTEQNRVIQ